MQPKHYTVGIIAAVWSVIYTIIGALMMGGAPRFRPTFYACCQAPSNTADAVQGAVAADTARLIGILLICAIIHWIVQGWWSRNRPPGNRAHPYWALTDLLTSFMPIIVTALVFLVVRAIIPLAGWYWYFQGVCFLIIVASTWQDIGPTMKYFRANRHHWFRSVTQAPAAPVRPTPPPAAQQPAPAPAAPPTPPIAP